MPSKSKYYHKVLVDPAKIRKGTFRTVPLSQTRFKDDKFNLPGVLCIVGNLKHTGKRVEQELLIPLEYMTIKNESITGMKKYYAIVEDHTHSYSKLPILLVSVFIDRIVNHEPSAKSIAALINDSGDHIVIYDGIYEKLNGKISKTDSPLYTNGQKEVLAIVDENKNFIWYRNEYHNVHIKNYLRMASINGRKKIWNDIYIIQEYYPGSGWEDVNTEETRMDAKRSLKEYNENMPYAHRIVKRKERIKPLINGIGDDVNPKNELGWFTVVKNTGVRDDNSPQIKPIRAGTFVYGLSFWGKDNSILQFKFQPTDKDIYSINTSLVKKGKLVNKRNPNNTAQKAAPKRKWFEFKKRRGISSLQSPNSSIDIGII